ncbi:C2 domain-containing protein [Crotalus adamanteus]|uniref:Rab11 family-interacting protein 2 n=1 Tax=Crotalus adamanteus TaxID=8729 RepID=A0AAW1BF38_CROAD
MLAEQAQKWFPTHVQVTVLQAKGLKPKGKGGTNDTYTIIQLGKEKYSTSVAEKTLDPIWKEEASFELPGLLMEGNSEKYILYLIVMHRSLVGLDKFLGQVAINLNDIFEDKLRRKTEWFNLESKQGKRTKDREKIKSGTIGNSYLFRRQLESVGSEDESGNLKSPHRRTLSADGTKVNQPDSTVDDSDSAFVAQNDPFTNDSFDFDSTNPFTTNPKTKNMLLSSFNVNSENSEEFQKTMDGNPFDAAIGYHNLTYEEVLQELMKHKEQLKKKDTHIRELEDYIDNLLVRVMEETPSILRVPYEPSRRAGKFTKT